MKAKNNNDKNNKLRQRLTKLFEKGNVKVKQVNSNAQKDELKTKLPIKMSNAHKDKLKTKPLPTKMGNGHKEELMTKPLPKTLEKPKSNIKVSTKVKTENNRKRKLQQNDAIKEENISSTLSKKKNKNVKTVGKATETCKSTKKNTVVKKKPKIDLPLVQHNGSNNVETSGSEDSDYYYDSDEDYSFEDDYGQYDQYDSYTDGSDAYSDSDESEHYFDDYGYEDSDSEYTECENEEYHYDSDVFSGTDPDYELPRNVAEDLVIHKGG